MKKLILLMLFLSFVGLVNCQSFVASTPTINATNNWDVKIITKVSFMNVAYLLGYSTSIDHNNKKITLTSCYTDATPLPGGSAVINTISIGYLMTGVTYTLNYTVFNSSNTSSCVPIDTIAQTYTVIAGPNAINEYSRLFNFSFFPNPTSNKVQFNWYDESMEPNRLIVSDIFGHEVKILTNPYSGQEIDLSEFSEGVYFIRIENEGFKRNFKIIKK
jgi:hypothetical protein